MTTASSDLSRFEPDVRRRIELSTSVRATDRIKKVPDAGEIRTADGVEVQVMHNGVLVEKDCYGGPWETEIIARLRGHHEPQEEIAFAELVERLKADTPAPVMVELGAYWAYYSLWLKSEIPSATNVLVEPDPANLQVGVRNFKLNGLPVASVVHAAVGVDHGSTIKLNCESDRVTRSIRTVTLDGLMVDEALPRVDLVLCDVQGAEADMLAGATEAIRDGKVRFMVISTHWFDTAPLLHQTCRSLIERLGGHIICEHSIPESCSGDGLVVASFDPRDRGMTVDIPIVRARESLVGELEWQVARRLGWRGILWGAADTVSLSMRQRLAATRAGALLERRVVALKTRHR